ATPSKGTAASATRRLGLGFVDRQCPTLQLIAIKLLNRRPGCGLTPHLHKAKPPRFSAELVRDEIDRIYHSGLPEEGLQVGSGHIKREIPNKQLRGHRTTSRQTKSPGNHECGPRGLLSLEPTQFRYGMNPTAGTLAEPGPEDKRGRGMPQHPSQACAARHHLAFSRLFFDQPLPFLPLPSSTPLFP